MAWKKIIFSGSSAELSNLNVDNHVTASNLEIEDINSSGQLTIDSSDARIVLDRSATGNDAEIVFKTNGTENWSVGTGQIGGDNDFTLRAQGASNVFRLSPAGHLQNLTSASIDYVSASAFQGDGSQLTNLTIAQVATVSSAFTNQTSVTVNHNFDSKNVQIQVFNDSDELIIPATVTLTDNDNVTITFDSSTSGHAVVAKGGHIVSGSVEFDNVTNKPTLLSGSEEGDAQGQIKLNGVNVNVNA